MYRSFKRFSQGIALGLSVAAFLTSCSSDKGAGKGDAGSSADDSGPASALDACKDLVSNACKKIFSCFSSDRINSDLAGNNETECRAKLTAAQCTDTRLSCDSGKTFQPSIAQQCLDQFETFSCDQVENDALPSACSSDRFCAHESSPDASLNDSDAGTPNGCSRYATIANALQHPTGTLTATNAAEVGAEFGKISANAASGERIAQSENSYEQACPAGGKIIINANTGACAQADFSYDDCCYKADCCTNGSGHYYYPTSGTVASYVYCISNDISYVCNSSDIAVDYDACTSSNGSMVYLVKLGNESFGVSGSYGSGTGTLKISAANGDFDCSYSNDAGNCTSATGGSFSF